MDIDEATRIVHYLKQCPSDEDGRRLITIAEWLIDELDRFTERELAALAALAKTHPMEPRDPADPIQAIWYRGLDCHQIDVQLMLDELPRAGAPRGPHTIFRYGSDA